MTTISNWQLVSSIYLPLTSTYYQEKFQSLIAKANPCFPKVFNLMEMTVFDEVETGAGNFSSACTSTHRDISISE